MLAYALAKGAENDVQRRLIREASSWWRVPDERRGVATTLVELAGTWAADRYYGARVAKTANDVLGEIAG